MIKEIFPTTRPINFELNEFEVFYFLLIFLLVTVAIISRLIK